MSKEKMRLVTVVAFYAVAITCIVSAVIVSKVSYQVIIAAINFAIAPTLYLIMRNEAVKAKVKETVKEDVNDR